MRRWALVGIGLLAVVAVVLWVSGVFQNEDLPAELEGRWETSFENENGEKVYNVLEFRNGSARSKMSQDEDMEPVLQGVAGPASVDGHQVTVSERYRWDRDAEKWSGFHGGTHTFSYSIDGDTLKLKYPNGESETFKRQ